MNFIKDKADNWTVFIDKAYMFSRDHRNYEGLVDSLRKDDQHLFLSLIDTGKKLQEWSNGHFKYSEGILSYKDEEIDESITRRIIEMKDDGFEVEPMLAFLANLYQNPSYRAITELYRFLENEHLPITKDGCFLAYKSVYKDSNCNYLDHHTKKIRNNVGDIVEMPRHKVDDNCNEGCRAGLHVGALSYANSFHNGQHVLVCKVNPADVVSIPLDSESQKVRCCRYEVVSVSDYPLPSTVYDYDDDSDDSDDDDDDWDDDEIEEWGWETT